MRRSFNELDFLLGGAVAQAYDRRFDDRLIPAYLYNDKKRVGSIKVKGECERG